MTREGYLKHKALIDAWGAGAEIQFKTVDGKWRSNIDPTWHSDTEYRIKTMPLEKYLIVDTENLAHCTYSSYVPAARFAAMDPSKWRVVHMKEVGND